jgi:gamma-glutamyltranspeptidase/glutathione hydrolase
MEKEGARIGFGIMGGWNQAQAHAQFVANLVDYGLNLQEALEAGRFSKPTFDGLDVAIEVLVPEPARRELARLGHELLVVPPRTEVFGFGQAVQRTPEGVNFGASEPRHDGMAVPQAPPVFGRR